jgi:GNAT superfamily N-acetyltransferase
VPPLTDIQTVRALLDRDREWAAYAIGDLAPGFSEHCEWFTSRTREALLMLYSGFQPPILFALGCDHDLRALFAEVRAREVSLHIRTDALDALSEFYVSRNTRLMRRMALKPAAFEPAGHADATPVGPQHIAAVEGLYDEGNRRGEGPTFFDTSMLRQNTFYGTWEGDTLIAIAGTHVYSADLGVCTIGNVYTRSDRRGRGLAASVTSAVIAHALRDGVSTIVLNVSERNAAARRVYERLGFYHYCDFLEGEGVRISAGSA